MRSHISPGNPFGPDRYGYLWERLAIGEPGQHLDYGAYDGRVLAALVESGVVAEGVGLDANADVVAQHAASMPSAASLLALRPGDAVDLPDGWANTASLLDVLEHVVDQRRLLDELHRVVRPGGRLVVTVPRRGMLSFLDTGNWKFRAPAAHRTAFTLARGRQEYKRRYVRCESGLFGDIEVGKGEHEHFTPDRLVALLGRSGFVVEDVDGAGGAARVLALARLASRGAARRRVEEALRRDAQRFASTHLFVEARRR